MHATLNAFNREMSRFFDDYFEEYHLATPYVELLLIVDEADEVSQKELAERMNLAPSTITRFVNKLVKRKLLKKTRKGRSVGVGLTRDGSELVPGLRSTYEAALDNLKELLGEKYVYTTEQLMNHGAELLKNS